MPHHTNCFTLLDVNAKDCSTLRCSCKKNGLKCSHLCGTYQLNECSNMDNRIEDESDREYDFDDLYVYNESEKLPDTRLSLKFQSRRQQKTISLYIMSSHNLESENGRLSNTPKHGRVCRQCTSGLEETLNHFIFKREKFHIVRTQYANFPVSQ